METRTLLVGAAVAVIVVAGGVLAVLWTGGMGHGTTGDESCPPADDTPYVCMVHPGFHEGGGHDASGWEKIRGTVDVRLETQGSIQRVEFFLDSDRIHTEDDGSWEFGFDTTPYEDCMYKFTAKAFADDGTTDQDTTQIWIDNTDSNCH